MDGAAFGRGITQEMAMRARDPQLIGYFPVNSAQVSTDLCRAALEDGRRLMPKVRIMAMEQQTHGAGLTLDRTAVGAGPSDRPGDGTPGPRRVPRPARHCGSRCR